MTFASKITIARIGLVPIYAALAFSYGYTVQSGHADESLRWWALAVFVTAACTDGVDGWVARRFNQCSDFGAYIDPIADKALLLTGVITLSLVDWGAVGGCRYGLRASSSYGTASSLAALKSSTCITAG